MKASSGLDFERLALPLLRIRWPDLAHPASMAALDRRGIDHVLVAKGDPLQVVVQCKGFKVLEPLGESQFDQISKSIQSFLGSEHRCTTYLLLYNRFGIDRAFSQRVLAELASLKTAGKASQVLLWDLNELVKQLAKDLSRRIVEEIQRLAKQSGHRERSPFLFGDVVLTRVPHERGEFKLRRHDTPVVSMTGEVLSADPLGLLSDARTRWTLVFGAFGAGKSTLSRRLMDVPGRQLLYVPAAALTHTDLGTGSENGLACAIIEYLGILNDWSEFSDEERTVLLRLAGPLLSARLRDQNTPFMLLIDAIDENRFYASAPGFQVLTTELSRAKCRVILTTRREHFIDHYLAYAEPLGSGSPFAKEEIQVLELHQWSTAQALEYIDAALNACTDVQHERLMEFRSQVKAGYVDDLAMQHPLLLAMAVDLVAEQGAAALSNRAELYGKWTRQKLKRDFVAKEGRHRPAGWGNTDQLIWAVLGLMADVALWMTSSSSTGHELVETIQEDELLPLAAKRFGVHVPSDLYTTTSFLEPMLARGPSGMPLKFFHRSFQEYFLAVALRRHGKAASGYPEAVRSFFDELAELA
jgi:hypothetical protein